MINAQNPHIDEVTVTDHFWKNYMKIVKDQVIPYQWEALNDRMEGTEPSYAIRNFAIAAGEADGEFRGMVFQDSDVAKWLEAVAYSLETNPDKELEKTADGLIDLIVRAQQDDDYLNTYFTVRAPDHRWTNLRDHHELYCAGHMIEAAVAYYSTTGKRKLLDAMCRFADYIDTVFGNKDQQIRGYDGHQEIELALLKLYKVTENKRYLRLATFFIDERGQMPHFFDWENEQRGDNKGFWWQDPLYGPHAYSQSHLPVRQQEVAVGHAVRAAYMYTAMAELAKENEDKELATACRKLWENVTHRQMYITAGIGAMEYGEAFSRDYDLPNDTCYNETCASIGLVFWANRMLQLEAKSEYADVMERALYNGIISGMDLDGQRFFYVNPLEVSPTSCDVRGDHKHVKPVRQNWFACACCPPNLTRMVASIGHYIYSTKGDTGFVHLYMGNESQLNICETAVELKQQTNYPWGENVTIMVNPDQEATFTLALRIPGWCEGARFKVNSEDIEVHSVTKEGYVYLTRTWQKGDRIECHFPMEVKRLTSHPNVQDNAGKIALQRGPVVYCLEETDNGSQLSSIVIPKSSELRAEYTPDLLGGVIIIRGHALREEHESNDLYTESSRESQPIEFTAVPYYAWCNRTPGEMLVWIRE